MNTLKPSGTWWKWPAVAVPVGALVTPLSFVLWHAPAGAAAPPPALLPALVAIAVVIPALAFGAGVAFVLFGRPLIEGTVSIGLSRATFVSVAWLLLNWWPHSNFHRVAAGWSSIIAIDFAFHTTVIAASIVVAAYFLRSVQRRTVVA